MILPASEILKARKDMADIISQFISQRDFKLCTLTDIVFEKNEPLLRIYAFLDRYKSYGTVINVHIQINNSHPFFLVRKKEFIRIKTRLLNNAQYSIQKIDIKAVEKQYFTDIISQYQVVEDESSIDKLVDKLITSLKGISRG